MPANTTAIPRLTMLDRQQCEIIHHASLWRSCAAPACAYTMRVRSSCCARPMRRSPMTTWCGCRPALVEWALRQAPSRIALCRRGTSEPACASGRGPSPLRPRLRLPELSGSGTGQRRPFTQADLVSCIRLVDALPELHFCMSMGIPSDAGLASPYRLQFAADAGAHREADRLRLRRRGGLRSHRGDGGRGGGGMGALRLNPTLLLYSEPTTPLEHTETATGKLLFMAEHGLPIIHSPAPMMGGTAPMTLAGGLALGNAEVLSSLVIHQLKRPGAPFVYGVQAHHLDMRTTISVYGAPEYELARRCLG